MNVLLIGGGGREHALAWKMKQSPRLNDLFIAPGNAGTAQVGTNVALKETDFEGIKAFVLENNVNIVVVGPEAPLVAGIRDFFEGDADLANVPVVGPDQHAAQLEGSKEFAKEFMDRHNIPTAQYRSITAENLAEGQSFLASLKPPFVLKADGLAGGKGVLIIDNLEEAQTELANMLDGKFGEASNKVVIEEFLAGIELSIFVLTDGTSHITLPSAKDYKRIGEGDTGLNTGGMGAISPVPFADEDFLNKVNERIIVPTIEGFKKDGMKYSGFVFIGLMNVNGDPQVIEYNVRMGDPETEVVIPRIKSDFMDLVEGMAHGTLGEKSYELDPRTATTVMLVSGGYPESYPKGKVMTGLQDTSDSILFHAGTKHDGANVLTNGGRVLAVTSYGDSIEDALAKSFKNAETIDYDGKYYRKDIGFDLV